MKSAASGKAVCLNACMQVGENVLPLGEGNSCHATFGACTHGILVQNHGRPAVCQNSRGMMDAIDRGPRTRLNIFVERLNNATNSNLHFIMNRQGDYAFMHAVLSHVEATLQAGV